MKARLAIITVAICVLATNFSISMNAFDLFHALIWVACGLYLVWVAANISLDVA